MKARKLLLVLLAAPFTLLAGQVSALSYCPRPNGVAAREVAHARLAPLVQLFNARFDNVLYVVRLPPELQNNADFMRREDQALRYALAHGTDPAYRKLMDDMRAD